MIDNAIEEPQLDLLVMNNIAKQPTHEWRIYLAALEYIKLGMFVVPVIANGKKLPRKDLNVNYGSASHNKKTIDKWFHPDSGKFVGYNIGICGGRTDGAFIIDLDRHDDEDGVANFAKLEKEFGKVPAGPTQETPSDGIHHFFRWQENAANSTSKIAKCVDTRGGEANGCKGHVVAFPSVVDGKMYRWINGGSLPDIPVWVMGRMGVIGDWSSRKGKGKGRGNENVEESDLEQPIEEDQVVNMLDHIDPNDMEYEDWVRVGMSIKSQLNNDRGLEIWDEWSKKGQRYKNGECQIRWNGFSDFGTVRGGTLFHFAKTSGWQPDKEKGERSGNRYDEIVERMNKQYCVVMVGGKLRVLREKSEYDGATGMHYDLLDLGGFNALLDNDRVLVGKDKPKLIPVAKIWMAHEGRRTYPQGLGLFPNNNAPEGYYNTWDGFAVEPRAGVCTAYLNHLRDVICNGDADHYDWLMDWLADMVQDPANPKGCAIVLKGGEGCGKGTFANAIGRLFGPHHLHLIDESHLTSNFNAHLMDTVFVFADEITWGGNKKSAGKLKGIVTEKNLVGERKGVDAIQYKNMIHLIVASNNDWVVPASSDSRRWFVLDVPPTRSGDHHYFSEIIDELNNGGLEALLHVLLTRKILDVNSIRRAPVTSGLRQQRIMNVQQDFRIRWWTKILESGSMRIADAYGETTEWPEYVVKSDLYDDYELYVMDRKGFTATQGVWAKKMIEEFGIKPTRIRCGGRQKVNVYKIPTLKECKRLMNEIYKGILSEEGDNDT